MSRTTEKQKISLQTPDKKPTQNDSNTFPTSSTSSPKGINTADATPNQTRHLETGDAVVNMPPEDSPPSQCRAQISKLSWLCSQMLLFVTYFIILIALSPLLVVIFLFMRLLQFIRHGRGYYDATLLKLSTRSYILQTIAIVCLESIIVIVGESNSHHINTVTKLAKHLSVLPTWLYGVTFVVGYVGSMLPIILCRIIPYQSTFGYDGFYLRDRVLEIHDSVFFWLLGSKVVEHVPAIKRHNILGLHTYRWIQVCLFVFIGCNAIILITWVIVWVLQRYVPKMLGPSNNDTIIEYSMGGKYLVYCANGLRKSINFVLIALMLLLVWVFYIRSHLNDTPEAKKVLEIGTRTCVSVLVCSVLWLIKTCVLLSWEVAAVYSRLSSELVLGGNQLYFLGLITRHKHDIFSLIYEEVAQDEKQAEENKGNLSNENKGNTQPNSNDDGSTHCGKAKKEMNLKTVILSPILLMLRSLDTVMRSASDSVEKEWLKQGEEEDVKIKKKKKRLSRKVKERVRNDLVLQQEANLTPTLHATQIVAQYLLSARKALSDDTFTSTTYLEDSTIIKEIVMKQLIDDANNPSDAKQQSSKDPRKEGSKHKWEHLKSELSVPKKKKTDHSDIEPSSHQETELSDSVQPKKETKQSEIEEIEARQNEETELSENIKKERELAEYIKQETELSEQIKAWMERSRNNCLFLANTLYCAKEVVDCLNNIISSLMIATTLIIWLLLTGFATTKVFVLIASPMLAATFIFGDTCKSFFQGIMFVYVVHPFLIGDLCFLDGKMMEVWTVGIWKTTFQEVGTRAEVIYTNTELSKKTIVNYKQTGFDWNDSIELEVSSLDTNQIEKLEGKIRKHLNDHKQNFKSSHNCVKVLITGSNMKLTISVQHNVEDLETSSTNFERVKRKQELHSQLTLKLRDLLEEAKRNPILQFYI